MRGKTLSHRGYIGVIDVNFEDQLLYADVHGLKDVLVASGETIKELEESFRNVIDDYLAFCAELGEKPDKPYSGTIYVRTKPEIHKQVALAAIRAEVGMSDWVVEAVQEKLASSGKCKKCHAFQEMSKNMLHVVTVAAGAGMRADVDTQQEESWGDWPLPRETYATTPWGGH